MFWNGVKECSENNHQDFYDATKITEDIHYSITLPNVCNTLRFEHQSCLEVQLIVLNLFELWPTNRIAYLKEISITIYGKSKLEIAIIEVYFMPSYKHEVLWDKSVVTQQIGSL